MSPRLRLLAWVLVLGLAPAGARAGEKVETPATLRVAYAARLAEVAAAAKEARLGPAAARLFEDAMALDPENAAARAALGWTRDARGWKAPDPRLLASASWPDDGEADLGRLAKRETAARDEHVRACVEAATAARARKEAPGVVEALLWLAIAADPAAAAPRQALAHGHGLAGWRAPAHAFVDDPAAVAREAAAAPEGERAAGSLLAAVPPAPVAGWPTPVPTGRAPLGGDAAFSLTDAAAPAEIARVLARARAWLRGVLGDAAGTADPLPPVAFLHVGTRDLANALLDAEPTVPADARAGAKLAPAWPLGTAGYVLVVGASPARAAEAALAILCARAVAARARTQTEVLWIAEGLADAFATRLFGASHGRAALAHGFAGDAGPVRRDDEAVPAFVRRLVATGVDPELVAVAAKGRALAPRDVAVAGAFLRMLGRRDPEALRRFLAAALRAKGNGPSRLASGVAAAELPGVSDVATCEEALRRYVLDVLPAAPASAEPAGPAWRTTKLERARTLPAVASGFAPLARPVPGSLWFAGRPYACEVVEDGQAVKLAALVLGQPPRVVRAPGVVAYTVPLEYGGGFHELRVDLGRDGPTWTVRAADAFAGSVDGHALTFLDLDLDGRYGGFERDGVVEGRGELARPLTRTLVLGAKAYELRRVGPDGREVAWRARPLAAKGAELDAFLAWNSWRTGAGLPALDVGPEAQARARLAAERIGALVGEARGAALAEAPFAVEAATARIGLDRLAASLAGRTALLDPEARSAGIAAVGDVVAVAVDDPEAPTDAAPFVGPAVFPPAGAEGLPRAGLVAREGLPISLHFPPGRDVDALGVEIALSGPGGNRVEGIVVPAGPARPPGVAAFVPKAPLAASTAYQVTASWGEGAHRVTRTSSFTTAR